MDNYLDRLNEQQRQAVLYTDGPQLVIAGAGSGKTRVLTYKIVHLLNLGYAPWKIMALTFTNKAAREMRQRVAQMVQTSETAQLWMGTFHSIFARVLRANSDAIGFRHDFTIYDTADSKSLIKMIIKDMGLDEKVYNPASVQDHISRLKNSLISPTDYENDNEARLLDNRHKRPAIYAIYKAYWNRCRIASVMDFDDLLFYTNILFRDNPEILARYQERFDYILVDEYQDTNFAQHLILTQLSAPRQAICMVGDDAQSIYSFRGANINNILQLRKCYPGLKTFKLEQNYRSTQNITLAANSLIAKNHFQIPKEIFSTNSTGSRVQFVKAYSDYEEGYIAANHIISTKARQGDAYNDFAILYRTNAQSRVLEEALRKRDIPYTIYGGLSFYKRKEIKDAISYFRLAVNPDDDEAMKRIINYPARGIGETTLSKLQATAIKHEVSLWSVISNLDSYDTGINAGTKKRIENFHLLIKQFVEANLHGKAAYDLAQQIITQTQLIAVLQNDNTPENISKIENLNELLNGVTEFETENFEEEGDSKTTLNDFLSSASLATDEDNDKEHNGIMVSLMTVHAAKGLEFKNVIIVGVEEDLFPSSLSQGNIYEIEEERRLLYVAITRAKTTCLMTYAGKRFKNGQTKECVVSRFVADIDSRYISASARVQTQALPQSRTLFSNLNTTHKTVATQPNKSYLSTNQRAQLRPQQLSKPTYPEVAPQQNDAGGYQIHELNEISVGNIIEHSRFGHGTITNIDPSGENTKISVYFDQVGSKTLLLKFARFSIIG